MYQKLPQRDLPGHASMKETIFFIPIARKRKLRLREVK